MTPTQQLIERLEAASGPEYMLDVAIWDAIYPGERDERFRKLCEDSAYRGRLGPADKDGYIKPLRAFTASIDAALTLVPEGARIDLISDPGQPLHAAYIWTPTSKATAATLALAICIAALRASEGEK